MSGSSNQRLREDRRAQASVSSHYRVGLPQKGALGMITIAQVAADQQEEVKVVNCVEILTNLPRAAYRGSHRRNEAFVSALSRIHWGDLRLIAGSFHFPSGYQMLVPVVTDRAAYSHHGYIAISQHHLITGFRFPIPGFLIDVLNLLKLALMQLTPSSYGQLLTLYLSFRRHGVPPLSDNIIQYCFVLKQCPLARGLLEDSLHNEMHYLGVRAGEYRDLLQEDPSLNVGNYKLSHFFVRGPEIKHLRNKSFMFSESVLLMLIELIIFCQCHVFILFSHL
ncbi:hypothetical protein ACOSP7_014451 [Xanthoceras sorbifolium]